MVRGSISVDGKKPCGNKKAITIVKMLGYFIIAVDPAIMGIGSAPAVLKLLEKRVFTLMKLVFGS